MGKWYIKHRKVMLITFGCILTVLMIYFRVYLKLSYFIVIPCALFLLFLAVLYVNIAAFLLMKKAIQQLKDSCDPYPLLEAATCLSKMSKSFRGRNMLRLNKSAALISLGRAYEAISELNDSDIIIGLPLEFKAVYYNNLGCAYIVIGQADKGERLIDKAVAIITDIKNEKIKHEFYYVAQMNYALIKYINNEFKEYEEIIGDIEKTGICLKNTIDISLLLAKIYIKTNRIAEVKEKLQYVIDKGNKLYAVDEAKELLEQIEHTS